MRTCFVVLLVCSLAIPAAAGDLATSVTTEAAKLAQDAPVKAAPTRKNDLLWPGVALMGGGGFLAAYGFMHTTGANVSLGTNSSFTNANIQVTEKHNTALGMVGVGMAAGGAILIGVGASKKNSARPALVVGPNRIGGQIRF
jgi:hypothetical protein